MKGSVMYREKENRYMGRFYFQKKRYHVYAKSESKCWQLIREKRKLLKEQFSSEVVSRTMTLNTWFDYWVNNFKIQQVKESTYKQYINIYNRYALEQIGKENINIINGAKIQKFINDVPAHSAKRKLIQIFKDLFDLLHKQSLIKTNPMALVVLPRKLEDDLPGAEKEESKVLSYADELILLEGIKKTRGYLATKFILYTGLRRGECIGLQWKNVDLKNKTITITQQWNRDAKKLTSPKTKAALRTIPLMQPAYDILVNLKKKSPGDEDFVFTGIKRLTEQLISNSKKFNISVNPHMLRHTFASRCYFAGLNPKIIQNLLGHESMDTTLNTYTHVIENEDKKIVAEMRQFFISINLIDK